MAIVHSDGRASRQRLFRRRALAPGPVQPAAQGNSTPTVASGKGQPVPAGATAYDFARQLDYVSGYTERSRFLFFDDGRFMLEYPPGPYKGTYTRVNDLVTFAWEGSKNPAVPWGATGRFSGSELTITYNVYMMHSGFEDAVYQRVP